MKRIGFFRIAGPGLCLIFCGCAAVRQSEPLNDTICNLVVLIPPGMDKGSLARFFNTLGMTTISNSPAVLPYANNAPERVGMSVRLPGNVSNSMLRLKLEAEGIVVLQITRAEK